MRLITVVWEGETVEINQGCKAKPVVLMVGCRGYDGFDARRLASRLMDGRIHWEKGAVFLAEDFTERRFYNEVKANLALCLEKLGQIANASMAPTVIFSVFTADAFFNLPPVEDFRAPLALVAGAKKIFLVMDNNGRPDSSRRVNREEREIIQAGALPLYCHHQMTVVGVRRLNDFLERALGLDLPWALRREFRGYGHKTLTKIALHISREDFNAYNPRAGALPKYPIGARGPVLKGYRLAV